MKKKEENEQTKNHQTTLATGSGSFDWLSARKNSGGGVRNQG
jgi:hypothetical protein